MCVTVSVTVWANACAMLKSMIVEVSFKYFMYVCMYCARMRGWLGMCPVWECECVLGYLCVIDVCVLKFCYSETGFIFCLNYKLLHQKFCRYFFDSCLLFSLSLSEWAGRKVGYRKWVSALQGAVASTEIHVCAVLFVCWQISCYPCFFTTPLFWRVASTHILTGCSSASEPAAAPRAC